MASSVSDENSCGTDAAQNSSDPKMTHLPLLKLPPEVRNIIYEFAFPQQDFWLARKFPYAHIHRLYPGESFDQQIAEFNNLAGKDGVPRDVSRATAIKYYNGQKPIWRCRGCNKKQKKPSVRSFCWRCKWDSGALLLVSKQIHAECFPFRMSALRPTIFTESGTLECVGYFRSRGFHTHVRSLSFWVDPDRDNSILKSVPDTGDLLRAFPLLKEIHITRQSTYALISGSELGHLAGDKIDRTDFADDVHVPTDFQAWVESLLTSTQKYTKVAVTVEVNMLFPETLTLINKAFKEKRADLGGFNIFAATRQKLLLDQVVTE